MSIPPSNPAAATCPRCGQTIPAGAVLGACPHCLLAAGLTSEPAAPNDAVPLTLAELAPEFPQLELLELLGRGGMGAVYKARQRSLDRLVALKLLRPGLDADPTFAERFTREARALAGLNHPGIVTLYEFGRTPGGLFFILMEFVDGVNLRQLLAAGRLAPREALAIIPPLCDALQYAHDRGLVHRDIKPENILVDRLGRVKVADFGLAKLTDRPDADPAASRNAGAAPSPLGDFSFDLSEAGKVMGTPRYMAPEQRERPAEVDHRADIYALGVVLYQMLTGELPDAKQLQPPSRRVRLDVRLDEIVLRALEKEPARRYQHATAMKTQVEEISATTLSRAVPAPHSPGDEIRRRPWPFAVVVLGLFVLGLYGLQTVAVTFPSLPLSFALLGLPVGIGLWRLRPWWRYAALTLSALWLMLESITLLLAFHLLPPGLLETLSFFTIDPMVYEYSTTGSKQLMGLAWTALYSSPAVLLWRWLRRPQIKALFAAQHRWSRPWFEWAVLTGAIALVYGGNFFVKRDLFLQARLENAQRAVKSAQSLHEAGGPESEDYRLMSAKADLELLEAEIAGTPERIARAKVAVAEQKVKSLARQLETGDAGIRDVEAAKKEAVEARARLSEIAASTAARESAAPPPAKPSPAAVSAITPTSLTDPRLQFRAVLKSDQPGAAQLPLGTESLILSKDVLLDEKALVEVTVRSGIREDNSEIVLTLNAAGKKRFTEISTTFAGERVAIVFDGHVLVAPRINGPISGGVIQISGRFTASDAVNLTRALLSAAGLPPPATPPQPSFSVTVLGAVAQPGNYPLRPGSTLLDALGAGGGFKPAADLRKVAIMHRDPSGDATTTTHHDVDAILKGRAENPAINPGDSVFLPERIF